MIIPSSNYSDFDSIVASGLQNHINSKNSYRHEDVCKMLTQTYYKKNHDYGDSFSRGYKDFGLISCMVRISDKYNRLVNLVKGAKQAVKDESVADTLLDMANYCIMTYMELMNNKEESSSEESHYTAIKKINEEEVKKDESDANKADRDWKHKRLL